MLDLPAKRPSPRDRVRHIDGREGQMRALESDGYLYLATVLWDNGSVEKLSIGFVERVGLPSVE